MCVGWVSSWKRKVCLMRVEIAEAEIAYRTDRTQFCVGSKVFVPFVLVQLVSKTLLKLYWQKALENSLTQSILATASMPGSAEESRLTPAWLPLASEAGPCSL